MYIKKDFTIVQNEWIYNTQISNSEFRVLVTLLSFGYGDNPSFPSQETVAKKIGTSSRSVRTHIHSLKEKGFLDFKRRGFNKSNQYNFLSMGKKPSLVTGGNLPPKNTSNKTSNKFINEDEIRRGMESIKDTLKRKGAFK